MPGGLHVRDIQVFAHDHLIPIDQFPVSWWAKSVRRFVMR